MQYGSTACYFIVLLDLVTTLRDLGTEVHQATMSTDLTNTESMRNY